MAKSKYANWYADRAWRAKRAAHLAKEPLCRYCAREGRLTPGDVVDHVTPHKGNRWDFYHGEVQTLCHTCHSSVKQREENGFESRIAKRHRLDHHWNR